MSKKLKTLILIAVILILQVCIHSCNIYAEEMEEVNLDSYSEAYKNYLKLSNEEKENSIIEPRKYNVPIDIIYKENMFKDFVNFIKNIFEEKSMEENIPENFLVDLNKDTNKFDKIYKELPTIDKQNNIYYNSSNETEELTENVLNDFRSYVKKHIMEDGQVIATINGDNTAEFNGGLLTNSKNSTINKTVRIIGWDDNFSKEYFNEENRPENDGIYIALEPVENKVYVISYDDLNVETEMQEVTLIDSQNIGMGAEFSDITDDPNPTPTPTPTQVTLTGIKITHNPNKTVYSAGENFDATGMVVNAIYSNGYQPAITNYTISNGTNLKYGQTSVEISYYGFKTYCNIVVDVNKDDELIGITLQVNKILWQEGDVVKKENLTVKERIKHWDGLMYIEQDGKEVNDYTIKFPTEPLESGAYTVEVEYKGFKATRVIGAKKLSEEKSLKSITVHGTPNKKTYTEGELFDYTGVYVTAEYENDDSTETHYVTGYCVFNDHYSQTLEAGQTRVHVEYADEYGYADTWITGITVNPNQSSVTYISIENPRTNYSVNETFTLQGATVTLHFEDGTSSVINDYSLFSFEPWGPLTTNDSAVDVYYDNHFVKAIPITVTNTSNPTTQPTTNPTTNPTTQPTATPTTNPNAKRLKSITVHGTPNKKTYTEGELFEWDGLYVTAEYENDDSSEVHYVTGKCVFNDHYSQTLEAGQTRVHVEYSDDYGYAEAWISGITVNSRTSPSNPTKTLTDIIIGGDYKIGYVKGERLDISGMTVKAVYSNNTEEYVTDYQVLDYKEKDITNRELEEDDTFFIVSYTKDSKTIKKPEYITVTTPNTDPDSSIDYLKLKKAPTKTKYIEGDEFETDGMQIEVYFKDGTHETLGGDYFDVDYNRNTEKWLKLTDKKITFVLQSGNDRAELDFTGFTVEAKKILENGIIIDKNPDKIVYNEGENFNPAGMIVSAKFNNGWEELIEDYEILYGTNLTPSRQYVVIKYGGQEKELEITVIPETSKIDESWITIDDSNVVYDGTPKKPEVTVKYKGTDLIENDAYEIECRNNINAGTATVVIKGIGVFNGSIEKTFTINKRNINKATVTIGTSQYEYSGTEKKPTVTLKDGNVGLKEGTDYTITYSNNIEVGTAKVTITGKGNYNGSVEKTFKIVEKEVSKLTIKLNTTTYTYDGTEKKPKATITNGDKTLVEGTDYTIEYTNNINAGTSKATIKGKGNYSGTVEKTFTITAKSIIDFTVTLSENKYYYDGTEKKPTVTVKDGNKALTINSDYTLKYSNNINVGTAKVTITAKGNYVGVVEKPYSILEEADPPEYPEDPDDPEVPENPDDPEIPEDPSNPGDEEKSIEKATIKLNIETYIFDGSEKTPEITVKDGNKTLVKGTDYTVKYENNVNAGTAKVTITGKGEYIGTVIKEYDIVPKSIDETEIELDTIKFTYDGTSKKPKVTVKDGNTILTAGTDYTIEYTNYTNAGTGKISITGKGNYTNEILKSYTISAKSLSDVDIKLDQTTFDYDGTLKEPVVTVTDGNYKLKIGTDYDIEYINNKEVGTAKVIITGKGNYTGIVEKAYKIKKVEDQEENKDDSKPSEENNDKKDNQQKDPTTFKDKIPQTGESIIIIAFTITAIVGSAIFFIKNKKFKDIK